MGVAKDGAGVIIGDVPVCDLYDPQYGNMAVVVSGFHRLVRYGRTCSRFAVE